jgi:PAS domain S-box-containing protein
MSKGKAQAKKKVDTSLSRPIRENKKSPINDFRGSNEFFQQVINSLEEYAVFTTDEDGNVNSWNHGAKRLLGFSENEIIGKNSLIFFTPEDIQNNQHEKEFETARRRGSALDERWHVRKDGTRFWGTGIVFPLKDKGGKLQGFTKIMRNLTGRKQAEEFHKMHSSVLDSMLEGVSVSDENGIIVYTNPSEDKIFGYNSGELLGKHVTIQNDYPPEENKHIVGEVGKHLKRIGHWEGEWKNRKKDGTSFITSARITTIELSGIKYYVCVQSDVTEQRKALASLRVSEERYRLVVDNSHELINLLDMEGNFIYVNPAHEKILGYSSGELLKRNAFEFVHSEDIRHAKEEFLKAITTGLGLAKIHYLHKDGHYVALEGSGTRILDEKGKPVMIVAIFRDITERERLEDRNNFLEKVSNKLVVSFEDDITLQEISKLIVPYLADYCRIAIIDKDNGIKEITVNHSNPKKVALAKNLYMSYKDRPETTHGIQKILQSGQPEMIEKITDKLLGSFQHNSKLIKNIRQIGLRSYMGVPLIARGQVIGAITFSSIKNNRYYTKSDLKFAEELAHRIALSLDNVRLFRDAQDEIKERTRVEEDLRQSEEQYRRLIDNSPLPLVIHSQGIITYLNRAGAKLIGADHPLDLIGKNIFHYIHPDYRDLVQKRIERLYKEKNHRPNSVQEKFIRIDGEIIDVEISSLLVNYKGKPAIQTIGRDITESKKAENALRASESKFRRIFESNMFGMAFSDESGRIADANDYFLHLLGYTKNDIKKGLLWESLVHPDYRQIRNKALEGIDTIGISPAFEIECLRKDKSRVPILIGAALVDSSTPQIASYVLDITDRKKLEQRKDDFVALASHELKTPLTSLKIFAQILEKRFMKNNDIDSARLVEKMDVQLTKLNDLITGLLDVSRVQKGKLEYRKDKFVVHELLTETVESIQMITATHRILADGNKKQVIAGDRDRIGQVLTNLINNAIKYSPNSDKIVVRSVKQKGYIKIIVKDFGVGIPKREQKKIFDRFFRATNPTLQSFPGLGLGLYISKEIIERHNGKIWVESEEGKGSTFYITLPIAN